MKTITSKSDLSLAAADRTLRRSAARTAVLLASLFYAAGAGAEGFCPPMQGSVNTLVGSEAAATAIARQAMVREFGEDDVTRFEPLKAEEQGQVWHVYGSLPPDVLSGAPEAEVCRTNGELMSVFRK